MRRAAYTVLLARACPSLTLRQIEHEIPLSKGYALIHAGRVLDGMPMIWPRPELSRVGRWWRRVRSLLVSRRGEKK